MDTQACSDTSGYNITAVVKNEWVEYAVDAARAGTYDVEVRVARPDSGRKIHIESDGVDKTGSVMFGPTGGWQTWDTVTITGVSLDAGQQVMRPYLEEWSTNVNRPSVTGGP
jgi:endo-1,4-beta-xylanase